MKKALTTFMVLAATLFAVHTYAQPAAAGKTNFAGSWKLNVDKSDFGQMPPPSSESLVITQTSDEIKVARTSMRDQGDMSYTLTLKLDGSDVPTPAGTFPADSPFQIVSSKAEWDGANLSVTQKTTFQGNPGSLKAKYSLSPDGKVLTISTDISLPMGDFTIKSVYDKQ